MRASPAPLRFVTVVLAAVLLPALAHAAEPKPVVVELNASHYLRLGQVIQRVSTGSGDIADVAPFPPDQLLITGKRVGQTTATVWFRGDDVAVYIIRVDYPVSMINDALARAFPDAKNLKVTGAGRNVVISGQIPDAADVERVETLVRGMAQSAAPEPPGLINLVTVPGDQQVQLEVSFSEVSRTALKEVGLNFWHRGKSDKYGGALLAPSSGLTGIIPDLDPNSQTDPLNLAPPGLPIIQTPLAGAFGAVFASSPTSPFPFSAALSILSERGYARTLSEPTLTALSGQEATFLAGGEFPVPIPQALNQIGIDYKKFGVQLAFTPTVIGDTIQLRLKTTVSDIDFGLGLRLASVTVPGLTERHSETTVRLRDGQSFAIAGLLSDRVRSTVDKVPAIGDLPILGALFRSTSYRREETELLVVVTARLVRPQGERPLGVGEDTTTDPTDLELFLLGTHESGRSEPLRKRRKPAGPVGFAR